MGWVPLVSSREDALQRNDEIQGQERLTIFVRLAVAIVRDGSRVQCLAGGGAGHVKSYIIRRRGQDVFESAVGVRTRVVVLQRMGVGRHALLGDGGRFCPAELSQSESLTEVDGDARLKIGQGEVDPAVAPVGRAQDRKQRLILIDWQQLAVAESPALRREIERADLDFTYKWGCHAFVAPEAEMNGLGWAGVDAGPGDDEVDREIRLNIGMRLAAAGSRESAGVHALTGRVGGIHVGIPRGRSEHVAPGPAVIRGAIVDLDQVVMSGDLLLGQGHLLDAAVLAQAVAAGTLALSHVHGGAAAEIRQCEGTLSIAAVGGADQVKQNVEFADLQYLTLTKEPALGREVSAEHTDLPDVR